MRILAPLVAIALVAVPASGATPPITIGEVTSAVVREDVDMNALLRGVLEQELPGVDMGGRARQRPAVLSLALVRMDRAPADENKAQVTCVVSATVRDKQKGALVAVLEGRARAENEERLVSLLERATLKSAVRGALARLPEALDAQR
jgi:hypothetical protein